MRQPLRQPGLFVSGGGRDYRKDRHRDGLGVLDSVEGGPAIAIGQPDTPQRTKEVARMEVIVACTQCSSDTSSLDELSCSELDESPPLLEGVFEPRVSSLPIHPKVPDLLPGLADQLRLLEPRELAGLTFTGWDDTNWCQNSNWRHGGSCPWATGMRTRGPEIQSLGSLQNFGDFSRLDAGTTTMVAT